jgi:rhamnogalacturonyl hydrolase YesR
MNIVNKAGVLKLKKLFIVIMVIIGFNNSSFPQSDTLKIEILKVINEAAQYATNILLDNEGKSRCEYSITEGSWYPYEEPWHTGQIINALVEAYKITQNKIYLDNAKRAGDWWCSLLIEDHPRLKGMLRAIHGAGIDNIIFATVSDGTPGLFNLYKTTHNRKYADVPTSAGNWMLKNMYIPEHGLFYDAVDYNTGEVLKKRSPFWPDKKEQTLSDVARPNNEGSLFKDMYEFTKDESYKKVFIELCNSLVEKQGPEGLWMQFTPNDLATGEIHPRFNLWNAESLLEGFDLTGDKKYLDAAKKTLQFYTTLQKKDGIIYYTNYVDGKFNNNSICGSAVSFAGMLWLRLLNYGVGEEFIPNIEKSLMWVLKNRFPSDHPDKNLQGAMINTKMRTKSGKTLIMQRDIGNSFGIRFLVKYYEYLNKQ